MRVNGGMKVAAILQLGQEFKITKKNGEKEKMNIYEMYGRLLEERDQEHQRHLGTLGLLRSIIAGEISIDQVAINDNNQWQVIAPEIEPLKIAEEKDKEKDKE